MSKKLPRVFANKIDKKINNNSNYYVSNEKKKEIVLKPNDINKKISDIFNSTSYLYRANVVITFKNGEVVKKIIGKNKNQLITIDNELIQIDDILDIRLK